VKNSFIFLTFLMTSSLSFANDLTPLIDEDERLHAIAPSPLDPTYLGLQNVYKKGKAPANVYSRICTVFGSKGKLGNFKLSYRRSHTGSFNLGATDKSKALKPYLWKRSLIFIASEGEELHGTNGYINYSIKRPENSSWNYVIKIETSNEILYGDCRDVPFFP
jgi:hypothetical protein